MKKRKKRAPEVLRAEKEPEAVREDAGDAVSVGDGVVRKPVTFGNWDGVPGCMSRSLSGTVVYVHPEGRFHVVEFTFPGGGKLRESFHGVRQ